MYPDGCTQFHIDYAAGGYDDKEDEMAFGDDLSLKESIEFLDKTDDYAWPAVKAELARLQTALDEMVREYHAAINEPVYAGTRLDWMHRCQAAEQRVKEQDHIIHSLTDTEIVLEGLDEPHIQG